MDNPEDHIPKIDYDILYAFSILTSIILAGVSEAANQCEMFPGPPLCIQKGGATKQAQSIGTIKGAMQTQPQSSIQSQSSIQLQELVNSQWLSSFMKLANVINDKLHNVIENVSMNTLNKVEHYALGDLGTKQFNQTVLDKLQNQTVILEQMTHDPQVQKTIKDLTKELSILSIQMLDMAKPAVDKLIYKTLDTIKKSAALGAKGLFDVGLNTIVSTISLIPVYGGIVALVVAFLRGFNSALLTAAPGIEFSTEAFFTALFTGIKLMQTFLKVQPKITQQVNAVRTAVQNLNPSASVIKAFEQKGKAFGSEYAAQALGAQALGAQALGAQALGAQALGAQALGAQALGSQALGSATALGSQALGAQALGAQALGAQALGSATALGSNVSNTVGNIKNLGSTVGSTVGSTISSAKDISSAIPTRVKLKQDGGRAKIQQRIQHITRRLRNTINKFTNIHNINNKKRLTRKFTHKR